VARRTFGLLVVLTALLAVLGPALLIPPAQASSVPKLIMGMGDEISGAEATPLYNQAPVNMVTSWYNNHGDLSWMTDSGEKAQIDQLYAEGKANELVVDLNSQPCYAVSPQFQSDIASLTATFKGSGPLYIVLFTEFDTYNPSSNCRANYLAQIMSAYVSAVKVIHGVDPKAAVALGQGGYHWSSSSHATTGLGPEKTAIEDSQFVAVQAMQECTNEGQLENEVRASVSQLSSFHKPIMISYLKLWGNGDGSPYPCETSAMDRFEAGILNDTTMSKLTSEGLFALGFMNDRYVDTPGSALTTAVADVKRYSGPSALPAAVPAEPGFGYRLTGADGGVFAFGHAPFHGSAGGLHLAQPIVGMAETTDDGGYWFVARDGGVFAFGDAAFSGSVPEVATVDDVVGMAASRGHGYWVATADGTTYAFGGAPPLPSLASLGVHVDDVVGIAATPDGRGAYLVASDGGVDALGDAVYRGSMGGHPLNRPIVGLAVDPATGGYWLVASDGGVFAVDAPFLGSTGGLTLNRPIVGMAATADGRGYWLVASDGGVFDAGDAGFGGSLPALGVVPASPVVGMAGH
jgi:hypothetical protein